jgi:hypothetical protein
VIHDLNFEHSTGSVAAEISFGEHYPIHVKAMDILEGLPAGEALQGPVADVTTQTARDLTEMGLARWADGSVYARWGLQLTDQGRRACTQLHGL